MKTVPSSSEKQKQKLKKNPDFVADFDLKWYLNCYFVNDLCTPQLSACHGYIW